MAVIKAAKGGKNLKAAMDYIHRKAELTSGKDCSDDKNKALEQMQITKILWDKKGGREHMHYIQSFEPGEANPQIANQIGLEWAEKNFSGHEVYIATHTDKKHIHNHFIVNTVNHENGHKIQVSPKDLERFKSYSDELCKEHGLSIIERSQKPEPGNLRTNVMAKYQLLQRINNGENVKSYILNAAIAVDQAIDQSSSRREFIKNLEEQGYKVEWKEQRKNITLTNSDGKKVRMSNLEKTFSNPRFSKEGMEIEFQRFKKQIIENAITINATTSGLGCPGNGGVEKQCGAERFGQIGSRSIETGRDSITDKSLGNIKRELQQVKERAGLGNRRVTEQDQNITRKQRGIRKGNHERSC